MYLKLFTKLSSLCSSESGLQTSVFKKSMVINGEDHEDHGDVKEDYCLIVVCTDWKEDY